jgi:nucleotide-binding universal stress UspA family protein
MYGTLLVPLDGSESAEAALPNALRFARGADSEIVLVRAEGSSLLEAPVIEPAFLEQATAYVERVARRLAAEGARVRSVVRAGSPARVIQDVAEEQGASLIAMSTHGRTGLAYLAMGSVAELVMRSSPIPVLLRRSFAEGGAPWGLTSRPFERLLVPLDGSRLADAILPHVEAVAARFNSRVELVHVRAPEAEPLETARAMEQLKTVHDALAARGIEARVLHEEGDPAVVILDLARVHLADLIAMTTHGRSGVSRLVAGSVTQEVLRQSRVPLLVMSGAASAELARRGPAAASQGF